MLKWRTELTGRSMKPLLATLLCLHVWTNPAVATAHQKWLWPNLFRAPKGPVWISVDVTWSDRAFTATDGTGEQEIVILGPGGSRTSASEVFVGKTKSTAEIELTKSGAYRIEAVDPSTYWTQLRVNGKDQWKKAPKNEVSGGEIVRSDLYYAEAVAYVTIGDATPLPAVDPADPLEIQLSDHPSRLSVGSPIEFAVMSYGKPVAKAKVNVFGEDGDGHHPLAVVDCDAQGRGKVQLKTPGRHLLSCELERAVQNDPKADIHAFNAYLTIDVGK
jgi:uncharacterized GH25 family protein